MGSCIVRASEKVMVSSYHLPSPGLDMSFAPEQRLAGFQAIGAGRSFPPKGTLIQPLEAVV